jgi:hypothetical protein
VIVVMPMTAALEDATVCEGAEDAERHGHDQEPAAEEHTFYFAKHVFSPFNKPLPDSVRQTLKVSHAIYGPAR